MELREGTQFGEYTVGKVLGEGAFGVVYLAHDALAHECALKILRPGLASERARFLREAQALQKIEHPGVVAVYKTGTIGDVDFIAMELLRGETLAALLARGKNAMSEVAAIDLAQQIARAVGAAHATGIVHRDLKPQNIFLVPGAGGTRVKVLDFGIAKVWDPNAPPLTTAGMLGTAFYMSPEQCSSTKDVDRRTDIYALGCILYEMLAGEPPFAGAESLMVVMRHLEDPPPRAPCSRPLADLVAAMLAKSRDDRPPTMQAVAAELDACLRAAAPPAAATLPPVFRPLPSVIATLPPANVPLPPVDTPPPVDAPRPPPPAAPTTSSVLAARAWIVLALAFAVICVVLILMRA